MMPVVSMLSCSWLSCTVDCPCASAALAAALYCGLHSASQGANVSCSGYSVRGTAPSSDTPNPYLSSLR